MKNSVHKAPYVFSLSLGKSYTITGTPSQPGILPRALDVIFSSLDVEQQLSEVKVRPKCYSELKYLNNEEVEKEQQWKIKILNLVNMYTHNKCRTLDLMRVHWVGEGVHHLGPFLLV